MIGPNDLDDPDLPIETKSVRIAGAERSENIPLNY